MNTVFKFHYNVWLLSGLAGALGTVLVLAWAPRAARWVAGVVATILVLGGLVYPLSASATRVAERAPNTPSLDGLSFIGPDDRAAIGFLREQVGFTRPVIAEAVGGQYTYAARMATYSGAAAVLGWAGHEMQWRGSLPELARREGDLRELYTGATPDSIRRIADQYAIRFIVVGDFERQQYGAGVDQRFTNVLPIAFRAGKTTIYRASVR